VATRATAGNRKSRRHCPVANFAARTVSNKPGRKRVEVRMGGDAGAWDSPHQSERVARKKRYLSDAEEFVGA